MKRTLFLFALLLVLAPSCKKDKGSNGPLDERNTGAAARELLVGDSYRSLQVQVSYMPGFAPDAAALSSLKAFLEARLNKPEGVVISTQQIAAASSVTLGVSEISALESANRSQHSNGSTAAIHILYTNGNYTENNVLGIAYGGTSVAIFGKKIHDNSGGIGQAGRTKLEATVLEHEIGHLLGLVDIGTPMLTAHKDPNGTAHCNNSNCLMYYAAETTDVLGFLISGPVPPLDAACVQDLQGNGGR
jgi:predicted Zn-dependent protease